MKFFLPVRGRNVAAAALSAVLLAFTLGVYSVAQVGMRQEAR